MNSRKIRTTNPVISLKSGGVTATPGISITDENNNPGSNCKILSETC
jgi:hypothetical protein